ncbi:nucleotidyltransferase domain-containing protein [Nitrospira sp. Kam-Ns4a]
MGYCGSYARGEAGAGSDLDLLVIVGRSQKPFEEVDLLGCDGPAGPRGRSCLHGGRGEVAGRGPAPREARAGHVLGVPEGDWKGEGRFVRGRFRRPPPRRNDATDAIGATRRCEG